MNPRLLMEQHDILPKKSLGQNFLHDPNTLEKIVTSADLMPDSVVLEVGPGTGELTAHLAQAAGQVIAVEVDERLRPLLRARFKDVPNVEIVYGDILRTNIASHIDTDDYIVVANLPYYITSAAIRHLLESTPRPHRMVVTVQLEVAERIVAKPGDMSLLAVSAQFYSRVQIITKLKAAVFWPRPEIASAVIRMDTYDEPPVDIPDEETFFRVARAGFSQKRKQLKNPLAGGLAIENDTAVALLTEAGIDPKRRAETLSLEEWATLTRAVAAARV